MEGRGDARISKGLCAPLADVGDAEISWHRPAEPFEDPSVRRNLSLKEAKRTRGGLRRLVPHENCTEMQQNFVCSSIKGNREKGERE